MGFCFYLRALLVAEAVDILCLLEQIIHIAKETVVPPVGNVYVVALGVDGIVGELVLVEADRVGGALVEGGARKAELLERGLPVEVCHPGANTLFT